jgi:hypothetical protein
MVAMKVAELITLLQGFNPEATVVVQNNRDWYPHFVGVDASVSQVESNDPDHPVQVVFFADCYAEEKE